MTQTVTMTLESFRNEIAGAMLFGVLIPKSKDYANASAKRIKELGIEHADKRLEKLGIEVKHG